MSESSPPIPEEAPVSVTQQGPVPTNWRGWRRNDFASTVFPAFSSAGDSQAILIGQSLQIGSEGRLRSAVTGFSATGRYKLPKEKRLLGFSSTLRFAAVTTGSARVVVTITAGETAQSAVFGPGEANEDRAMTLDSTSLGTELTISVVAVAEVGSADGEALVQFDSLDIVARVEDQPPVA